MKSRTNIMAGFLVITILLMAVAYSTFAIQLTISGTAEIIGEWNVEITNIEIQDVSQGCDAGSPQYTNSSATFNAKLLKPGDYITYLIMIQNNGNIDATLSSINFSDNGANGSSAISYNYTEPLTSLPAGAETCILLQIKYNEDTTEVPSTKTKTITGIVEYDQAE